MNRAREFLVERLDYSSCSVTVLAPGTLGFCIWCNDNFYGFDEPKPVPLGQLLTELGVSAADCERAIEEWQRIADKPGS